MVDLSRSVFLRSNVICEPLVSRWYAWSYLLPPATASLYFANHNLKLLQSFVTSPQVHVQALKRPEMAGGPFINHPVNRLEELRNLLDDTRKKLKPLLELAQSLKDLDALVQAEATGASLEPLYERVPKILRGYVELVYDLHHRPSFRVIERLLYDSPLYDESSQSFRLSLCSDDQRAFVLSTPRLEEPGCRWLETPFRSPLIDELCKARTVAKPLGFFTDILKANDAAEIAEMFTETAPSPPRSFEDPGVRIRYLGHACVLVESRTTKLLFDPIVPYQHGSGPARASYAELPPFLDYVVITHNHQDHVVLETLLQLRHRIGTVVVPQNTPGHLADPSLKLLLRRLGFRSVISIEQLDTLEFDGGVLTALPFLGEHGDLDVSSKAAHHLRIEGRSILLAADSNNLSTEMYQHLSGLIGELDILFVGMECAGAPMSWLYGPLLMKPLARRFDQGRRLDGSNSARVLSIVDQLKPRQLYIYAMGAEPWIQFISSIEYTDESGPIVESNRVVQECTGRGITAERLFGYREIRLEARR